MKNSTLKFFKELGKLINIERKLKKYNKYFRNFIWK